VFCSFERWKLVCCWVLRNGWEGQYSGPDGWAGNETFVTQAGLVPPLLGRFLSLWHCLGHAKTASLWAS
jgi:hypothetical protein